VRWAKAIPVLSWALSGVLAAVLAVNGLTDAKERASSPSIIVVDSEGRPALLDTLLAPGEIGLIETRPEPEPPEPAPSKPASSESISTEPAPSEPAPPGTPKSAAACVNINTADEKQLVAIKGIGPALAANIIAYRTANGPFRKKEDIQKVKGIGPAKLAQIIDSVCF
jgi:competence ComEA-like helix-hairpin-helix protein